MINREDIIRMAREAGFVVGISEEHWGDVPYAKLCHPTPNQTGLYSMLENLIRKAAAAEREAILPMLKGIDSTETEDPDGWWETSAGADFGAGILAAIRARGETK